MGDMGLLRDHETKTPLVPTAAAPLHKVGRKC